MSDKLHSDILVVIHRVIDSLADATVIETSLVARQVVGFYDGEKQEPHLQYMALEQAKDLVRRALAGRYDRTSASDVDRPGELFAGVIQDRYPINRRDGAEPVYKRLDQMSQSEIGWNVTRLRKAGQALFEHADALEAYGESRAA